MNRSTLQINRFKLLLARPQPWAITKLGALYLSSIIKGKPTVTALKTDHQGGKGIHERQEEQKMTY